MAFQIVKLCVYIVSIAIAMYGLSCFNYDGIINKNKTREFYAFYFIASMSLGYLFASLILEFMTINF